MVKKWPKIGYVVCERPPRRLEWRGSAPLQYKTISRPGPGRDSEVLNTLPHAPACFALLLLPLLHITSAPPRPAPPRAVPGPSASVARSSWGRARGGRGAGAGRAERSRPLNVLCVCVADVVCWPRCPRWAACWRAMGATPRPPCSPPRPPRGRRWCRPWEPPWVGPPWVGRGARRTRTRLTVRTGRTAPVARPRRPPSTPPARPPPQQVIKHVQRQRASVPLSFSYLLPPGDYPCPGLPP